VDVTLDKRWLAFLLKTSVGAADQNKKNGRPTPK
jgi:hypothetical protein